MPLVLAQPVLITGASKPNVVVRIARRIVQIQRKRSRIDAIIPIAAADETATHLCIPPCIFYYSRKIFHKRSLQQLCCYKSCCCAGLVFIQLASILPISFTFSAARVYCFTLIKRRSLVKRIRIRRQSSSSEIVDCNSIRA